ncbi:MAG: (Fe-S)-binding protein [Promethearchaeota archaeon]
MSSESKTLYFIGCTTAHNYPETFKAMKKILDVAGIEVEILEDEPCCGGVLFMIGQIKEAIKKARENFAFFKSHNIGKIIVNCPECYKAFLINYPKVDENFNIKIQHSTQVIAHLIREGEGKLTLTKEIPIKVTYHDSCHLGRHCGIYDEPRFIIKSIPGIKFNEMEFSGKHAICCGGPIRDPFIELRNQMSLSNLNLAKRFKNIITACPTCYYNLDSVSQLFEHKVQVIKLIDLVAYSAGLIPEFSVITRGEYKND